MGNYAYGDTRLDFPYGNIPHMHTVSDWNIPVVSIRGLHKSPYAYGDYVSCDPRMHRGISAISVCIWGLILIPVCTWGSHDMQSPYAYGDSLDLDPHPIWFIAWRMWKFWFNAWLEERSLTRQKLIPVRIRGVLICERAGIQKNLHMGSPCRRNEIVRRWGLTYMPHWCWVFSKI